MSNPYHLILAMREPYLTQLLNGEKTAEVRRTAPDLLNLKGCRLYLYHKKHIYGHVTVQEVQRTHHLYLDSVCNIYARAACLPVEDMKKYLYGYRSADGIACCCKGIIYFVGAPVRYAEPVAVPCRPQSWQYMTGDTLALLPDGKEEQKV